MVINDCVQLLYMEGHAHVQHELGKPREGIQKHLYIIN